MYVEPLLRSNPWVNAKWLLWAILFWIGQLTNPKENGTKSNHGTFTFSRSKIEYEVIQFFLGVSDKLKAMKKLQNVTG